MECKICKKDFISNPHWHHKWGICDECRIINIRRIKAKYKKTEKGRQSYLRWCKNPIKKEIDKRYSQTPKARHLAVLRATKCLHNNPHLQERKRQRDREFARTEKGKEFNRKAKRKYSRTPKGKISSKNGKAKRRSYLENAGKFTLEEWENKLKQFDCKCVICKCNNKLEVDHIIPISKGGMNTINNIQPLCRSCNAKKNNKVYENNL